MAELSFNRALDVRRRAFGANDDKMIREYEHMAEFYRVRRRFSEAERLYEHAIMLREHDLGLDARPYVDTLLHLAEVRSAQGFQPEAEAASALAREAAQALSPGDPLREAAEAIVIPE